MAICSTSSFNLDKEKKRWGITMDLQTLSAQVQGHEVTFNTQESKHGGSGYNIA
jgi:hypothetical protein